MATKGAEKFEGVGWSPASTGAPLIDGVLGYVDCTIHPVHEAGDHYVVLGRVQELGVRRRPRGRFAAPTFRCSSTAAPTRNRSSSLAR